MRSLLYVFLSLAAAALAGVVFCAVAGWQIHGREMSAACIAALLAASGGLFPAILNRESPVETVMQAALVGSVLHMMFCLIFGVLMWVGGLARVAEPFAVWLMLFYLVSLAAVAATLVRFIRRAACRPSLHNL
jgi:hypothetical protein